MILQDLNQQLYLLLSALIQVVATDADGPEFGTLLYSLSDGFDGQDQHPLFHVHPQSGELCVSQDIDGDSGQTVHDILIRAEDPVSGCESLHLHQFPPDLEHFHLVFTTPQGGLSAQTYVHVEVEDLNDNVPVFNPDEYSVSISSHAQPGAELLNLIATDRDSGTFGQVSYDIVPGDVSSLFDVDSQTGEHLWGGLVFC